MKQITEFRRTSDGKCEIDLYGSRLDDAEVDALIRKFLTLDAEINYADADSLDVVIRNIDQKKLEELLNDGWTFGDDKPRCLCDICKMECDARDGPKPIDYGDSSVEDGFQPSDRS